MFVKKKRLNNEMFIDRMATLYVGETQIRAVANEGDQQVGTIQLE